jgi:hypothetical protein
MLSHSHASSHPHPHPHPHPLTHSLNHSLASLTSTSTSTSTRTRTLSLTLTLTLTITHTHSTLSLSDARTPLRDAGTIGQFNIGALLVALVSSVALLAVSRTVVEFLAFSVLPLKAIYKQYRMINVRCVPARPSCHGACWLCAGVLARVCLESHCSRECLLQSLSLSHCLWRPRPPSLSCCVFLVFIWLTRCPFRCSLKPRRLTFPLLLYADRGLL